MVGRIQPHGDLGAECPGRRAKTESPEAGVGLYKGRKMWLEGADWADGRCGAVG